MTRGKKKSRLLSKGDIVIKMETKSKEWEIVSRNECFKPNLDITEEGTKPTTGPHDRCS